MTSAEVLDQNETQLSRQHEHGGAMVGVAQSRAAQEVQAAMIVAKRDPRDEQRSLERILKACKRPGLAERAQYKYPRGDTTVIGPSIRLAETMAQCWGNLDFGIVEVEQRNGESTVMAYCWDLETNTRQTKIFQVPHMRHTKKGSYRLYDPRDIYELTANQGARRLRACILGIIPGDVVDAAVAECEQTMKLIDQKTPLDQRIRKMVKAFEDLAVDQDAISRFIGKPSMEATERDFASLRKVYNVLVDNLAPKEAFFPPPAPEAREGATKSDQLADQIKKGKGKKPQAQQEQGEKTEQGNQAPAATESARERQPGDDDDSDVMPIGEESQEQPGKPVEEQSQEPAGPEPAEDPYRVEGALATAFHGRIGKTRVKASLLALKQEIMAKRKEIEEYNAADYETLTRYVDAKIKGAK